MGKREKRGNLLKKRLCGARERERANEREISPLPPGDRSWDIIARFRGLGACLLLKVWLRQDGVGAAAVCHVYKCVCVCVRAGFGLALVWYGANGTVK